jgi:uncharacterized membrane protein
MSNRKRSRVTARYQWDRLRVSFWFAPVIMSLAAVLLAWLAYWIDSMIPNELLETSPFILTGNPTELRSYLIGMAGTVLATAGVVFTLLTLPLSTVVAQYGSRLLRVFLGDRTTQLVLGMFVATFVYCLAAAMSIPPMEVEPEGPQITATVGLLLMLGTFASLILLIQHISMMLQAPNIAAAAGAELRDVVQAELPETTRAVSVGQSGQEFAVTLLESEGYPVNLQETGYIELVDPDSLLDLARENDLVIRLLCKPGRFIRNGETVALVWPSDRVGEKIAEQIRQVYRMGTMRTPTQDIAYAVNQLVEMGVRAMSPAINDPFTAMTCLDYIGEGLSLFLRHWERSSNLYDTDGRLRLFLEPVTFDELLDTAFNMLRHASCDNASVLLHMLAVIEVISRDAKSSEAHQILLQHANLILLESEAGRLIEPDRESIRKATEALRSGRALDQHFTKAV